ncbi:MAG TPA: hypothetical protein VKR55_16525 [Bradyrhizobium sp.]|uniref:hypothetical protein n=1 Tax=Bradyrhizobium sp. TaxID=376 RepID=UPI002C1ABDD8|nr:hypothetical protein [Bradyrhizobium sp.]HLZ03740.1 hypothetical protein [Bradyrhizobium sp.]
MTEETTDQFLARREQELTNRAAALRGQLAPIEAELAKVQRMKTLLEETPRPVSELAKLLVAATPPSAVQHGPPPAIPFSELLSASFANWTIKDLVIQALLDGFPHGATTLELTEFIRTGYSREIDPASLRTQLHRLKAAGILGQEPNTQEWNFRDGKRPLPWARAKQDSKE